MKRLPRHAPLCGWSLAMAVVTALTAGAAFAQSDPAQDGLNASGFHTLANPGGPMNVGDPISLGGLRARYAHTDLTLPTSLGAFTLETDFSADPTYASSLCVTTSGSDPDNLPVAPPPSQFGQLNQLPRAVTLQNCLNKDVDWSNNLYAYVDGAFNTNPVARLPSGESVSFHCPSDGSDAVCQAEVGQDSQAILSRTGSGSVPSIVVYQPGVGRYYFGHAYDRFGVTYYFLTRVESIQYGRTIYSVSYATSADLVGECDNTIARNSVGPLPLLVTTGDGAKVKFHYQEFVLSSLAAACVVAQAALVGPDGGETQAVSYDLSAPGVLSSITDNVTGNVVSFAATRDSTTDRLGSFEVDRALDGGMLSRKELASFGNHPVASDITPGGTRVLTAGTGLDTEFTTCPYSPADAGSVCEWQGYGNASFIPSGNGTSSSATVSHLSLVKGPSPGHYGTALVSEVKDSCTAGDCTGVSTGIETYEWTGFVDYPSKVAAGSCDKTNSCVGIDAGVALYSSSLGNIRHVEIQGVRKGATGPEGQSALSAQEFQYSYMSGHSPDFHEQLLASTSNGLSTSGYPHEQRTYDSAGRLTAVDVTGVTERYAGGAATSVTKTIRTQYLSTRASPVAAYDSAVIDTATSGDAMGRTLEVDGPCDWSGSACEGVYPRTQYFYYKSDQGLNANKLAQKTVFVTNPDGQTAQLTTKYNAYDIWGNVTQSTDSNGIVTTNSYNEHRLLSSTVGYGVDPETTTYVYGESFDKPTAIRHPSGMWEVFCYRYQSPLGSTCAGTLTDNVQWKAKTGGSATAPDYSTATERVDYLYDQVNGNGRMVEEDYKENVGGTFVLRRAVRHQTSPTGNATYEQVGVGAGAYATAAQFNGAGDRIAQGFAYNFQNSVAGAANFNAFCGVTADGTGTRDSRCAGLGYDRLHRLTGLWEAPASGGSANTNVDYDGVNGSISSISTYLLTGSEVDYGYDDFGNLLWVKAPWTTDPSNPSTAGTTRYAYDAQGHITYKQTPEMDAHSQYVTYEYDSLGRELSANLHDPSAPSGVELLYSFGYGAADNAVSRPASCGVDSGAYLNGLVRRRTDSFGTTWYAYDGHGRIVSLKRQRKDAPDCDADNADDNSPSSAYVYANGLLTQETYPHGRVVKYGYGADGNSERVTSIQVDLFTAPLITNIQYEPYGGVRSYDIKPPDSPTSTMPVEYLHGDSSVVRSSSLTCAEPRPGTNDSTGRIRALWVSTNSSGLGDMLKRFYTYSGDQTTMEESCFLSTSSSTEARRTLYSSAGSATNHDGYDNRLRLQHVSRPNPGPSGQFGALGGTVGKRDFTYDKRGNRLTETDDCWDFTEQYDANSPDKLLGRTSVAALSGCPASPRNSTSYTYDLDGRVASITWPTDSSGQPARKLSFDPSGGDGWDGVYREVSVNGQSYQYEYDAVGRRRAKHYPSSLDFDEFFYDDSRMVEDRAASTAHDAAYAATYPLDEYIWLDGKPVILIKSELDKDSSGAMTRRAYGDASASCDRGDGAECGVYFIVDDPLGKPVLMVDSQGRATGEAEYTPFGLPNRVTYLADTAHPNNASDDKRVLGFFKQPHSSAEAVRLRARFAMLDVASGDWVEMADSTGGAVAGSNISGLHDIALEGPWVSVPGNGLLQLRFRGPASTTGSGVTLAGYEYERYQAGASPVWTRLGFPGQYYDPETDLFENWHRYYDANTGRYLEPDDIWRGPGLVLGALSAGHFVPVYGYSLNNPIGAMDPTGEHWVALDSGGAAWVDGLKSVAPKLYDLIEQIPGDVTVHADGRVPPSPQNGYRGMDSMPDSAPAITSVPYLVLPSSGIPIPAGPVADISVNPNIDLTDVQRANIGAHETFHVFVIMGKVVVVKVPECKTKQQCEEAQAEGFARAVTRDFETDSPYFIGLDREKFFRMGKAVYDRLTNVGWVGSGDVENRGGGAW